MTDTLTALQEAEGKVKAAREAYASAQATASQARALADASETRALEEVGRTEAHLLALLDAEQRRIDDRRARLFANEPPAPSEPPSLTESVFQSAGHYDAQPLRPISLNVSNLEEQVAAE